MAERLTDGNVAIALLGNTIPTGAILVVLITALGPVSGAHFNPAVTLAFLMRREIRVSTALLYLLLQVTGGIFGTFLAHLMFEEAVLQFSTHARAGPAQWLYEVVASFGLVSTILATRRSRQDGGTVYHRCILVHCVYQPRKPSRNNRARLPIRFPVFVRAMHWR
jgi:glycerol uptake facilitator-like aquaporin